MTPNDDSGSKPRRPERPDAPTQALPKPDAAAAPQRGTSSTFERSAPSRPLPPNAPGTGGGARPASATRPSVPRPTVGRADSRGATARPPARNGRRAKLALRRIDPWSVFLFSLLASIFLGIVLLVAVTVLYAVLSRLGVLESVNDLFGEVAGDASEGAAPPPELITSSRVLSGTAVLAAVDIVLITALATLGALLYNLCAALTGGIEVTLGERD